MPAKNDSTKGILFWDLVGTILDNSRAGGKAKSLPGIAGALARLQDDYTVCLTTGDFQQPATESLRDAGLLQYFHQVYGRMWAPVGKPYDAICTDRGVPPEHCLAIGDRLNADIPADTDRLVTVIINQVGFSIQAEAIVSLVELLTGMGGGFLDAFERLTAKADPVAADEVAVGLGEKTWRYTADLDFYLTWYRHPIQKTARPVILLPG